jgi:hypothetical protein
MIEGSDVELGRRVPLIGRFAVPIHGELIVLLRTLTVLIHLGEVELYVDISLFGGSLVPLEGKGMILGDTELTLVIGNGSEVLG